MLFSLLFQQWGKNLPNRAGGCLSAMRKIISVVLGTCINVKGTQGWSLGVASRLLSKVRLVLSESCNPVDPRPLPQSLLFFYLSPTPQLFL